MVQVVSLKRRGISSVLKVIIHGFYVSFMPLYIIVPCFGYIFVISGVFGMLWHCFRPTRCYDATQTFEAQQGHVDRCVAVPVHFL